MATNKTKYKIRIPMVVCLTLFLASCEPTKNEEELCKAFFQSEMYDTDYQKLKNYNALKEDEKIGFYEAVFDKYSDQKPWEEFDDSQFGKGEYTSSGYHIKAKESHQYTLTSNKAMNYNQDSDFQIEFRISGKLAVGQASYMGIKYNTTKNNNGIGFLVMSDDYIGKQFKTVIHYYNSKEVLFKTECYPKGLFTIRKIGDSVSYFKDKILLKTMSYIPGNETGVCYIISKGSEMNIEKLTIEYIR